MPKSIKVYNTLTGEKDTLKPLKGKKVNLFVCGPTVYDFLHIGNGRTYVLFDNFVKYLKHMGYTVFYLQNITDIDDKIIMRAREKGVEAKDLARAFEKTYLEDMKSLGVTSVNKYARATDYIRQITSQVTRLMEKGFAYQLEDGIYFEISKFKGYGKLSGRTALQAEDSVSRIDYAKDKRNRGDFCVWKYEMPGEPSWPAPFGRGRPGWHIEDTAITEKFFGPQYDIHGGAIDLVFPHHEAEITQMEALSGKKPLAKYWMHGGFLTVNGQKMAKSGGNMVPIRDFLQRYSKEQMRFWISKSLWHSPLDYSESTMIEIRSSLERIEEFLWKLKNYKSKSKTSLEDIKTIKNYINNDWEALADDFNTPQAFAHVFDLIKAVNTLISQDALGNKEAKEIVKFFDQINKIFGIINEAKLKKQAIPAEVMQLVAQREEFRKNLEWQKADGARLEIAKYGYTIEDTQNGPLLKKL